MTIINVFEAKTTLSQLLARVSKGEEIIIGKHGEPIAVLVPYKPKKTKRNLGGLKGKLKMSKDFDEYVSSDFLLGKGKQTK
jgi:prevent-host-death family protein